MSRISIAVRIAAAAVLLAAAAACGWRPVTPDVESEVLAARAPPGGEEARGLQVYPLRNPAVTELREAARAAEQQDDHQRANELLERALRIAPRDPELLQHLAEISLARGQFDQAEYYATRSYELGPRVGVLCRRNWQTLALARERQGRSRAAEQASASGRGCDVLPPERF